MKNRDKIASGDIGMQIIVILMKIAVSFVPKFEVRYKISKSQGASSRKVSRGVAIVRDGSTKQAQSTNFYMAVIQAEVDGQGRVAGHRRCAGWF